MFEKEELVHMGISVVTITLAFSVPFFLNFPMVFLTFGIGFLLHELAHKFMAMRLGCIAVYRAWLEGLVIAVIMAFATAGRFVFAAPGAVYIWKEHLTKRENGLISLAGPGVNIVLALFFVTLITSPQTLVKEIATWGFYVNSFYALFNMVPIPPLDGSKVASWSIPLWAVLFIFLIWLNFIWPASMGLHFF
jgi:Zn-dependent protease